MNKEKLLRSVRNNPVDVRFSDLCRLAQYLGFALRGGRGSHRVYTHPSVKEILNFQNVGGKAKPYQVRQFLSVIEAYGLELEGRHEH
ncbi:MAG TPA: hypothetical protein DCM05_06190 [Elusimicrobia bacterium]|nr:hypothetical protein [Elusimicrobiota bacterium]